MVFTLPSCVCRSSCVFQVLIANNGMAGTKAILSMRQWCYLELGDEKAVEFVAMATSEASFCSPVLPPHGLAGERNVFSVSVVVTSKFLFFLVRTCIHLQAKKGGGFCVMCFFFFLR